MRMVLSAPECRDSSCPDAITIEKIKHIKGWWVLGKPEAGITSVLYFQLQTRLIFQTLIFEAAGQITSHLKVKTSSVLLPVFKPG